MQYRRYGRHDITVSEIGLGGHREGMEWHDDLQQRAPFYRTADERARLVGHAIARGVTYFDTSVGWELVSLGESLRLLGKRDGLFVSGCKVDFFKHLLREGAEPREYTRRWFDTYLQASGLDYFDQYLLGALDARDPLSYSPAMLDDALDELAKYRDEGKVRYLAFSVHDADYAARLLERYPQFDAVMTPYNYANRTAEGNLQPALARSGAAWVVMKTLIWQFYALPISVLQYFREVPGVPEFDPRAPIGRLAHRFVLQHPRVTTCVPAMNALTEVEENTAASDAAPLTERENAVLQAFLDAALLDNSALLCIGGLFAGTLRVRTHALWFLKQHFNITFTPHQLDAPDVLQQVDRAVQEALSAIREHPVLAKYLACCSVEV